MVPVWIMNRGVDQPREADSDQLFTKWMCPECFKSRVLNLEIVDDDPQTDPATGETLYGMDYTDIASIQKQKRTRKYRDAS